MRHSDKASLQAALIKKISLCGIRHYPDDVVNVLDDDALLQKLPWPNKTIYANLSNLYLQYVLRHYNHAVVVFDGYANGPSTYDETHQRRASSHNFKPEMQLIMEKKSFSTNKN